MEFQSIQSILSREFEGKEVSIRGWIYRTRSSGGIAFVVVRDSTSSIQVAVKENQVSQADFEDAKKALIESAIEVVGNLKADPRAPTGYEVQATSFKVTHFADIFPISKDQSPEWLLDNRHLWIRSRNLTAVMKVKATVLHALREFFRSKNVFEATPPIIITAATEGGSTLFEMNYFGKKAFLSQSAQLHLEALIFSLEKVFAITPSFRAEKSRTLRHLAEYWHAEAEFAYFNLNELIDFEEEMIRFVVKQVIEKNAADLETLGRKVDELKELEKPFARMTYDDAIKLLAKNGTNIPWGEDLGTEEERILSQHSKVPIIITHYPKKIKAFYMKVDGKNKEVVLNNDVLAPEGYGEILGASQREEDVDILTKRIKDEGNDPKDYEWYLDLRKYGSIPHSGFGLGVERLVRWICKLEHIRDAIPFPRVLNRAYP